MTRSDTSLWILLCLFAFTSNASTDYCTGQGQWIVLDGACPCANGSVRLFVSLNATCTDRTDHTPCSSSPCFDGTTCVDGIDSYVCKCPPAFTGDLCQMAMCSQISPMHGVDPLSSSGFLFDRDGGWPNFTASGWFQIGEGLRTFQTSPSSSVYMPTAALAPTTTLISFEYESQLGGGRVAVQMRVNHARTIYTFAIAHTPLYATFPDIHTVDHIFQTPPPASWIFVALTMRPWFGHMHRFEAYINNTNAVLDVQLNSDDVRINRISFADGGSVIDTIGFDAVQYSDQLRSVTLSSCLSFPSEMERLMLYGQPYPVSFWFERHAFFPLDEGVGKPGNVDIHSVPVTVEYVNSSNAPTWTACSVPVLDMMTFL